MTDETKPRPLQKSEREVRESVGKTQVQMAVEAGVSPPTVSKYEANPNAVKRDKRAALDQAYAKLRESVEHAA